MTNTLNSKSDEINDKNHDISDRSEARKKTRIKWKQQQRRRIKDTYPTRT